MKFEVYKKIIDEISIYRHRVKSIAMFMDGDPTLHKELINFLIYAKQKKIKNIYLSSNMEFFSEKLIDQIFEHKLQGTLKYIIASLDGVSEQTHNSNRIGVIPKKLIITLTFLFRKKEKIFHSILGYFQECLLMKQINMRSMIFLFIGKTKQTRF